MKYLLDTSAISQMAKEIRQGSVIGWLDTVDEEETFLSAITFAELRQGIELLPAGKRRNSLDNWLRDEVTVAYRGRILPVDEIVADMAGRITVEAKLAGFNVELSDILIAATARVHDLKVATLNRKHFGRLGVELVEF